MNLNSLRGRKNHDNTTCTSPSGAPLDRKDLSFRRRSGINFVGVENGGEDKAAAGTPDDTTIMPPPNGREPLQATASIFSKQSCIKSWWMRLCSFFSIKLWVLVILCLQNSLFTVARRYSQGVLHERYSKYEVLLMGEVIKMLFSAWMIAQQLTGQQAHAHAATPTNGGSEKQLSTHGSGDGEEGMDELSMHSHHNETSGQRALSVFRNRLYYIISKSDKMAVLAAIYGAMNILSFVSLRNIGAGMFTIFAQCKILTTATFSTIMLQRQYSSTQWRALVGLMFGVLLFSEPSLWGPNAPSSVLANGDSANPFVGTMAVLIEVTLSGFASIYFEKVIKTDSLQLSIWERNFQLALTSFPVYVCFIVADGGGESGLGGGWTAMTWFVALLGAAGGLLVALSIKYGDAILKTLATTGAIVLSSVLDYWLLDGPLTPTMIIAAVQVVLSIFNYTFDMTPAPASASSRAPTTTSSGVTSSEQTIGGAPSSGDGDDEESRPLVRLSSKNEL